MGVLANELHLEQADIVMQHILFLRGLLEIEIHHEWKQLHQHMMVHDIVKIQKYKYIQTERFDEHTKHLLGDICFLEQQQIIVTINGIKPQYW